MSAELRVAVVGATGAVGTTMLALLREREFPAAEIIPFASERSAGKRARRPARAGARRRRRPRRHRHRAVLGRRRHLARVGAAVRRARRGRDRQLLGWRMDPDVPLVVSEVNPQALAAPQGLIANPNCSTMQAAGRAGADPRRGRDRADRVRTYQSVSGTGHEGDPGARGPGARDRSDGGELPAPEIYPAPIAFNVIGAGRELQGRRRPHRRGAQGDVETRKILEDESIGVAVTCVRVPVRICHSEAIP